jgi:3-methyladenine DNA glycosylase/8-oxoguanine DNA glycosylase
MTEVLEAATVLDIRRTFGFLRMGMHDPTSALTDDAFVKTFMLDAHTPARHSISVDGASLRVRSDGAGSLDSWAAQLPIADGHDSFVPRREHPVLHRIWRSLPGLRFLRVPWLFDLACGIILQQRVSYEEAISQYQSLARRHGVMTELGRAFPAAQTVARLAPAQLQQLGIDPRRGATLIRAAREHVTHDLFGLPRELLVARLSALAGVGPWTVGMVRAYGLGDEDAVPMGDLHLPHVICQALAHQRRGDDARMLELLTPYSGHRGRVVRLVLNARIHAPALLR